VRDPYSTVWIIRLPDSAHTSRPWRIHPIAADFRLEDVWALPTPGGPDDFPRLVRTVATLRAAPAVRGLMALRWWIGAVLKLDRPRDGLGARVPSLRDRLPDDLRDGPRGDLPPDAPFRALYLTADEWALEIANRTVHAVLHLGWVGDHGQMAVLVKPNGRLGAAYMTAITPFRHLIVYPQLTRDIARAWR
jgi:hypothetical protein